MCADVAVGDAGPHASVAVRDRGVAMDTRSYLYLSVVERCHSVPRAAKELGITPQGLARAIRRLEDDIGSPVYVGALGMSDLTEQGRCVLEHGTSILAEESDMRRALDAINAHAANVIRLGCSMGLLGYLGEGVVTDFNRDRDCQVFVSEELPDSECEERLIRGEYDCALLVNPPATSLSAVPIVEDYQFMWVNRGDPLASRDELRLSDLDGRTIYTVNDKYRNTGLLLQLCAEVGVRPVFRFTSEMMRVYECARAGKGLGLTCRNHVEATSESQKTVGLPLRALPWGFSLCYHREHVPTAGEIEFMDYMRSLARRFR